MYVNLGGERAIYSEPTEDRTKGHFLWFKDCGGEFIAVINRTRIYYTPANWRQRRDRVAATA
jgi:hypothetical protein